MIDNDQKIIKKIENEIGFKLNLFPLKDKIIWKANGYILDESGQVIGLNLDNLNISDISFLQNLTGLMYLSLRNNKITKTIPQTDLKKLICLDLSGNQITDLTPLGSLTNLKELIIDNYQFSNFPNIKPINDIEELLNFNNQIIDLAPLVNLKKLSNLYLDSIQITDLTPLSALIDLTELSLNLSQITDLTPLANLKKMTFLSLNGNQITDLTPLCTLTNLIKLHLSSNQITDLTPLSPLKKLETLNVQNNLISSIPLQFAKWWPKLKIKWIVSNYTDGLNLYGNPLSDLPVEVVRRSHKAVLNYFAEIKKDSVLFLESKLLLVGQGDVGKTSLMKKLKNNEFKVIPGTEDTTRGIDIQPWELSCTFPNGDSHPVKIHFWDFAGQDILHATHQFFLTKRSLYIFVWDPRREDQTRSFDYWLNAIKLFGDQSPIIVVMNKSELRIKEIDEASFKDKFPSISQFIQLSCVTNHNIPQLTGSIRTAFSRMPHLLDKLPKRWLDIRDRLNKMNEDYITLNRYFDICGEYRMDEEKAIFLSDYLHDLGIILHFRTDPILADTVILKPQWATGALYALIDSLEIQKNKGRFNRSDLTRYWDIQTYPIDKHTQLLRLMEKFELCFNIAESDQYIIPELLPAARPDVSFETYSSSGNLHLHYSYEFMPAGIVTRFICRIHHFICDDRYWQNGVELQFAGSSALIVNDTAQKRIRVSVSGSNNSQLMGVIRSHFDRIHDTLHMKKEEHFFEKVPCICSKCATSDKSHLFSYDELQKMMEKNRDAFCGKSSEDVSVHQLLNGFLLPEPKETLFDSIITTLSQVQGLSLTIHPDENSRNSIVALLLSTRGYRVKDQSLWGSSHSGISTGELDIKIEDERGRIISIIEALNLDSINTSQIHSHVYKLLDKYNCNGLDELYILAYVSTTDFSEFCHRYNEHLPQIDYGKYPLTQAIEFPNIPFNTMAAYRTTHICHMGIVSVNHILVKMPTKSGIAKK